MQEGYVIPACDIIDDIRRSTKARELRVPTMNDVLCLASRYGNVGFVKSLIAAGVVVNEKPGFIESSTALSEAAEHEQLEVMKVLLSAGAKFDKQGGQQYGKVAVLAANHSKHTGLAKDQISTKGHRSDSSGTSAVEGQAHTHGFGLGFIELNKTEDSHLTSKALERLQKSQPSQLDTWVQTLHRHEVFAIGEIESLESFKLRFKENWKPIGVALPPTIMSH